MSASAMSPQRILILGGGTAGWMFASLMAKRWAAHPVEITLQESARIVGVSVRPLP